MSDEFCLKWNDFKTSVSNSFSQFRNEDYLHDVTLVSDDHKKISAHKLVLSACSEYFKDIFKNNHHPHPLICLDGVSSEDLRNIMDYMYNGEVQIYQDNLDRFLVVAQRLKLEGLIGSKEEKEEFLNEYHDNGFGIKSVSNVEINSSFQTETEQLLTHSERKTSQEKEISVQTGELTTIVDENSITDKYLQYIECSEGRYKCTLCGKMPSEKATKSHQKYIMKKHMEIHMEGLTYTCPLCQKSFRSRNSLQCHKSVFHNSN